MGRCLICGKEIKESHKFKHGEIFLCSEETCTELVTIKINNDSIPLLWADENDLKEQEILPEDRSLDLDDLLRAYRRMRYFLGDNDTFWECFNDACKEGCEAIEEDRGK